MFPAIRQQGNELCWAGCFEYRLRQEGIFIPQANIVSQVKGRFIDQAASIDEITNAFNGLIFTYGYNQYQVNCNYIWTAPCPWVLKSELNTNRSLFVTYNAAPMGHMVVAHQATFTEGLIWDHLQSVIVFDPGDSQNKFVTADSFYQLTEGCVSVSIIQVN